MAYAIVTHVNLEGRLPEDAERMLADKVIPAVKALPGFQRGVWLRSEDGLTGTAVAVFDSEENAKSAHAGLAAMRPADAPPITSSEIHAVTGLA